MGVQGQMPRAIFGLVCVRKKCVFDNQAAAKREKLLLAGISSVIEFDRKTMLKLLFLKNL